MFPSTEQSSSGGLGWLFKAVIASGSTWTTTDSATSPSTDFTPKSTSEAATPEMVPVTVTPEPRRLFGFGPTFQPPSETVMMPAEAVKQGDGALLQKIRQEGITSRGRKITPPPTYAEINTFASFST